jgi:hypothetical protein
MALNRTLAALAFLASAIVLCMVVAIVATGFSQELFELAPSPLSLPTNSAIRPRMRWGCGSISGSIIFSSSSIPPSLFSWRCVRARCSAR